MKTLYLSLHFNNVQLCLSEYQQDFSLVLALYATGADSEKNLTGFQPLYIYRIYMVIFRFQIFVIFLFKDFS